MDLNVLAERTLSHCEEKGWDRGWVHAGCYLHLEVSEFVEALRQKNGLDTNEEAADVLFVLFSTLAAHDIQVSDVLKTLRRRFS